MEFNLWPLVGSILLLGTPSYLFFTSHVRRRVTEAQHSGGFPLPGIFLPWQNWLDLVRAAAGAYLLFHHTFELDRELESFYEEFGWMAGVFAVGIMLNVYYRRRHLYCLAPVFYITGISLGLFLENWWMVLYGVVAGLVFGRIINLPEAFFIVMGLVIGAFGYFFKGGVSLDLLLLCALTILPIVYAFATKRGLVVAASRTHTIEEEW